MAPVLLLPPEPPLVWVGLGVPPDGVRVFVDESVLLSVRLNVLTCLGGSSGSPDPLPR